jgi:hypothetical protein
LIARRISAQRMFIRIKTEVVNTVFGNIFGKFSRVGARCPTSQRGFNSQG